MAKKKRRSFMMLDADYAKLKAEKERQNQENDDSPSATTVSDVLHGLIDPLPDPATPRHAKKKRSKAQSPPALALSMA